MSNTKYLFIILIFLFLVVATYRYKEYIVDKNFTIEVNTICDPSIENCFYASEDLSFGQNPYKKISILARYAPKCLEEHTCESFSCSNISNTDQMCVVTYCSDENKTEGEECLGESE